MDVDPAQKTGSGLRSTVMWDPASGAKFANNEPMRPFFRRSQINLFHEDQRGDGIQHAWRADIAVLADQAIDFAVFAKFSYTGRQDN